MSRPHDGNDANRPFPYVTPLRSRKGVSATSVISDISVIAVMPHEPPVPVVTGELRTVGRQNGRQYWIVAVQCPYCGQEHLHAGGDGTRAEADGRRQSHCSTRALERVGRSSRGEYEIHTMKGTRT